MRQIAAAPQEQSAEEWDKKKVLFKNALWRERRWEKYAERKSVDKAYRRNKRLTQHQEEALMARSIVNLVSQK